MTNNKLTDEKIKARINAIEDRRSASRDFWDGDYEYPEDIELLALLEVQERRKADNQEPASERERIRREHAEWSDATFGEVGPIGPLKHLSKEALEAAADPSDPLEWADMQFLLWDAQRRMGISDEFITRAMIEKLAINKARKWPEPKDGEPRLHIKEAELAESEPNGILPCPFCGGMAERVTIDDVEDPCFGGDVITCVDCGASSHVEYAFKENLVSVWNNRAAPQPVYNDSEAQAMLKHLAVIMAGNDSGGELAALTVTAKSLVDRCKALAVERDTLAALPPPFPLPDVSARVFSRVAYRWALTADQIRQIYQAIGTHLEIETSKLEIKDFPLISDVMNAQAADPAQCVSVGYTPQLTKYQPEPGISGKKTGWVLIDEHGIKQAVAWLWTHPNGHCDLTFPQTGALGRAAARIAGGWSYTPLAPCGEPSQELESGAKS